MIRLFPKLIRAKAAVQLAALTISLSIVGFTYAFAEELGLKVKPSIEPITPSGITLSGAQSREWVEAEMITLTSNGFEPAEITRPQGPFLLALFNHSGLEEISIELRRDNGSSVRSIVVPKRRPKFREGLDLVPGRYVLTEANHPEWICMITIAPR